MSLLIQKLRPSPFEMEPWPTPIPAQREKVGDFEISFIEQGRGDALIFIHGLGGSLTNWNYNFFEFAKTHRCIALDLPGYGNSSILNTTYYIDLFAKTIVGLMDKLGIEKATMIGNSMGGHTGAWLGIHYPDRVDKLVLADPSGTLKFPWHLRLLLTNPELTASLAYKLSIKRLEGRDPEQIKKTILAAGDRIPLFKKLFFHDPETHPAKDYTDFLIGHIAKIISKGQFYEFLWMFTLPGKMINQTNITADLQEVKAPTLLVWGDDDRQVPLKFGRIFHQYLPGSKLLIIPEAGHVPMIEKPYEFNKAVAEFLAG